MLESIFSRVLRAVFGGGADISAANPLPVDTSAGLKVATTILDEATIAATITTALADCDAIDLSDGDGKLAVTIRARYAVAATQGIKVHMITSPTNDATGAHTGGPHATIMTDDNAHFVADELVGLTIENVTDGSSGEVTANTETTVTVAALAGGAANAWALNDVYSIDGADFDTDDWDSWSAAFALDTVLRQTKHYDVSPKFIKVLIENLDPLQDVTFVEVVATVGP